MARPIKLGVLIGEGYSGGLSIIIKAIEEGFLNADVVLVVSSQPNISDIEVAKEAGIPVEVMRECTYNNSLEYADTCILDSLMEVEADYIVLAGYARKITDVLQSRYEDKTLVFYPPLPQISLLIIKWLTMGNSINDVVGTPK